MKFYHLRFGQRSFFKNQNQYECLPFAKEKTIWVPCSCHRLPKASSAWSAKSFCCKKSPCNCNEHSCAVWACQRRTRCPELQVIPKYATTLDTNAERYRLRENGPRNHSLKIKLNFNVVASLGASDSERLRNLEQLLDFFCRISCKNSFNLLQRTVWFTWPNEDLVCRKQDDKNATVEYVQKENLLVVLDFVAANLKLHIFLNWAACQSKEMMAAYLPLLLLNWIMNSQMWKSWSNFFQFENIQFPNKKGRHIPYNIVMSWTVGVRVHCTPSPLTPRYWGAK